MKELKIIVFAMALLVSAWAPNPASTQGLPLSLQRSRQQKAPTPGYQSKAYPLLKPSGRKERQSRFIPLKKNNPASSKNFHHSPGSTKGPGPSPEFKATPNPFGKPITAWAPGIKKNYTTLYQDPR